MTARHDSPAATEERVLMPRSSPRPAVRRHKRGTRYSRNGSEREYSALADQLDALEHDIDEAREAASLSRRPPGLTSHAVAGARAPSPHGVPVGLADGARILIRPIEPGDAQQLEACFAHLGAVSRYRRFLAPIDHLSARQLVYLTQVDHNSHEAFVAIDPATGQDIGVARFVRDPADARQAEVALVVADVWQRRGVGAALAERLAARARAVGVESLTARMLVGNHGGRRLLEQVSGHISHVEHDGTIDFAARLRTSP
jgi:RimJ/RimL family protein N-acetyltransferase